MILLFGLSGRFVLAESGGKHSPIQGHWIRSSVLLQLFRFLIVEDISYTLTRLIPRQRVNVSGREALKQIYIPVETRLVA